MLYLHLLGTQRSLRDAAAAQCLSYFSLQLLPLTWVNQPWPKGKTAPNEALEFYIVTPIVQQQCCTILVIFCLNIIWLYSTKCSYLFLILPLIYHVATKGLGNNTCTSNENLSYNIPGSNTMNISLVLAVKFSLMLCVRLSPASLFQSWVRKVCFPWACGFYESNLLPCQAEH